MESRFNIFKSNKPKGDEQIYTAESFENTDNQTVSENATVNNKTLENEALSEKKDNAFNDSLKNFCEENILQNDYKSEKNKKLGILNIISVILCVSVCAAATFMLGNNIYGKFKGEELYNDVANKFTGINIGSIGGANEVSIRTLSKDKKTPSTLTMEQIIEASITGAGGAHESYDEELAKMRASLTSLKNVNPDIYGWISIDDTSINYPIVQGEDNDYYLDHAYTGDYLPIGSIFADFRCSETIMDNLNTVMYGHNITTGSMFNNITLFFNEEYFSGKKIYVYTPDGVFIYEPFSIYETTYDSGYIQTRFETGDEYVNFLKRIEGESRVANKGYELTPETKILTLSTCTNGAMVSRYAFHAILVSTITE